MQAVEQQVTTVTNQRFVHAMARVSMIVAMILIAVVITVGAILVTGGSIGSQAATKATVTDALAAPGLAAFRAGEKVMTVWTGHAEAAPGLAAFPASEKAVTAPWTGDALAAPGLAAFRASEHSEAP